MNYNSVAKIQLAAGRDSDEVRPSAFPDFVIPLAEVWG